MGHDVWGWIAVWRRRRSLLNHLRVSSELRAPLRVSVRSARRPVGCTTLEIPVGTSGCGDLS
jgi:hypothetical protein